jgi:hypothetical protein
MLLTLNEWINMNIIDWFDPYNHEHLAAYQLLLGSGTWPAGFIPIGTKFPHGWYLSITQSIAMCWVKEQQHERYVR